MQDPCSEASRTECRDYSNGGPAFLPDEEDNNIAELAWYQSGIDGAAALKCKVRLYCETYLPQGIYLLRHFFFDMNRLCLSMLFGEFEFADRRLG